jgi:hypothetical protein
MGKARAFSDSSKDPVYQKEYDDEIYSSAQQNSYNLGSTHFSDQSGIGNFTQAGNDQRKANIKGALFQGNIGFNLQTVLLDVGTNTIDLNNDSSGIVLPLISTDRFVTLSSGSTADLITITGVQRPGQRLRLYNTLVNTITIKHTAAATVNTIRTPDAGDLVILGNGVVDLTFDITTAQWRVVSGGGGGGGAQDPIILNEFNHGNQGPVALDIDWSIANFHRMVLTGGVGITHINLPATGKWEQLVIEFIQDIVGGHIVTYTQGFANAVVPLVNLAPGSRTTVVFYSYFEAVSFILAFETMSAGNTNYIHATKTANQAPPLTVGTRATFDAILANSGITVAAGIFSGFRAGRTYECECSIACLNAVIPPDLSFQFFDIASAALIGSRGNALGLPTAVNDTAQSITKAIFIPTADSDTLEVQFGFNNDLVNTFMWGIGVAGTPQSYVMIKDIT